MALVPLIRHYHRNRDMLSYCDNRQSVDSVDFF